MVATMVFNRRKKLLAPSHLKIGQYASSHTDRLKYYDRAERTIASITQAQTFSDIARERVELVGDVLRVYLEAVSNSISTVFQKFVAFLKLSGILSPKKR